VRAAQALAVVLFVVLGAALGVLAFDRLDGPGRRSGGACAECVLAELPAESPAAVAVDLLVFPGDPPGGPRGGSRCR
jgi:hypothetical protein